LSNFIECCNNRRALKSSLVVGDWRHSAAAAEIVAKVKL
jgi:hypothetical protein